MNHTQIQFSALQVWYRSFLLISSKFSHCSLLTEFLLAVDVSVFCLAIELCMRLDLIWYSDIYIHQYVASVSSRICTPTWPLPPVISSDIDDDGQSTVRYLWLRLCSWIRYLQFVCQLTFDICPVDRTRRPISIEKVTISVPSYIPTLLYAQIWPKISRATLVLLQSISRVIEY